MSVHLSDVAITEFEADVHQEFRAKGFMLKDAVRAKTNVVGNTVQWPVALEGIAKQKAVQDDVVPMNIDYNPITATMEDWYAAEYTDIFDQQAINFDDRMELVQLCAHALGRRSDQKIIDVMDAGLSTANPDHDIANGGTNLTFAKIRQAFSLLRAAGAMQGDIHCLIDAEGERKLLSETAITSSDFVNNKVLANGGLANSEFMGVKFHVIPDMTEGGLPSAGNIRTAFMWNRRAVGYASGFDLKTTITYENVKTSWLVNCLMKMTAAVIDNRGLVGIDYDITA